MQVKDFLMDTTIMGNNITPLTPEISIIMYTYNEDIATLKLSIESILAQTFHTFEFIIIDDGSRNSTLETLLNYQKIDSRITIIRHEFNSGLPGLRLNEGIMSAKAPYIFHQTSHTICLTDSLEYLYNQIKFLPQPSIIYGNPSDNITPPFIYNKSILNLSGLYDPHILLHHLYDYDLSLRISRDFSLHWLDRSITTNLPLTNVSPSLSSSEIISPSLKKYLAINRAHQLTSSNIADYMVDTFDNYTLNFTTEEIDYMTRYSIIPFKSKLTYLMSTQEKKTYTITRASTLNVLVTKWDYTTSIDITLKNFMCGLRNFPYKYHFSDEKLLSTLSPNSFDLAILFRTISQTSTHFLNTTRKHKKPTAYLMDDHMFKFYELGPEFNYLSPDSPGYFELTSQVKNADLVITYNKITSDYCKQLNQKVYQLKTNIPISYLQPQIPLSFKSTKIHFGIFSGPIRKKEIKYLWPVLEQLSHIYKDKISLSFWGINPSEFGNLECEVDYKPFTDDYNKYINALQNNPFHFHICPLIGNLEVTQSKSPIKFLEGTICGSIGIFSDVPPYDELPNCLCIKVENTLSAWYSALENAILMSESDRYDMYTHAAYYISENYSTESQAFDMLGALESLQLHAFLKGKKIAYMFHESHLGGATLHLLKHAQMLQSIGVEVLLCLSESQRTIDALPKLVQSLGFSIYYLPYNIFVTPTNFGPSNEVAAKKIATWITLNNVGLVHESTFIPTIGLATRYAKVPNIANLHQYYPDTTHTFDKKYSNIQTIICDSNYHSASWEKILNVPVRRLVCPVENFFFYLYPTNYERNKNLLSSQQSINILISGTLQERKNQLEAIKCIKLLRNKGYNVSLDLIGYDNLVIPYTNLCYKEIKEHQLEPYVQIHGFTSSPEDYYKGKSHILLCASTDESMPQTILQAMASGIYVVTTPVAGTPEIIKDSYNGIITTGYTAQHLAEGLEKLLLLKPTYQQDLLRNAYDTINSLGSYHYVRSELLAAYNLGIKKFTKK